MPTTIPATILATADRFSQRVALREKVAGAYTKITYGELAARVRTCAAGLQRLGVVKGDRVAICSANGVDWVVYDLGIMLCGGVTVPVHTSFSPALMRYILDHAGARVLVVNGPRMLEKILAMTPAVLDFQHLITISVTPPPAFGNAVVHRSEELIAAAGKLTPVNVQRDDLASIVYTSGTTGLPRGVMLTHGNFLSNISAALDAIPIHAGDIFLSFLPLSHVLERTTGNFAPLSQGAQIAYAESPAKLRDNAREIHPTILISVPRMFEKMHDAIWANVNRSPVKRSLFTWALRQRRGSLRHRLADQLMFRKIRGLLGGRLRLSISGGAPLYPPLAKFFRKLGLCILEGYGLTETAPVVAVNTGQFQRLGSVGKPLAGVEVRVGPEKEIYVRGDNVCRGYWHDDAVTADVISADGWLRTGDLGFLDADGFLFIIGRCKEMLVTAGGKNIWPQVLENAITGDPLVAQTMVIAHRRPYVVALVVPTWSALETLARARGWPTQRSQLVQHPEVRAMFQSVMTRTLADRPDYELVRRFILLPQEFSDERDELTPTQKLRRSVIERHYAKEIAALYASAD